MSQKTIAIALLFASLTALSQHAQALERPVSQWTQLANEPDSRHVEISKTANGQVTSYAIAGEGLDLVFADVKRLQTLSQSDQIANADWLYKHRDELPSAYILEVARVKLNSDPEEAMTLFSLGMIRMRYDAFRCTDKSAGQSVIYAGGIARSVALYISEHKSEQAAIFKEIRTRDDLFSSKVSPWWICSQGIRAMTLATSPSGFAKDKWLVAKKDWPDTQKNLLDAIDRASVPKPAAQ